MTTSAVHAAADRVHASLAGSWDDFGRTISRHDVRTLLTAVRPASADDLGIDAGTPAERMAREHAVQDLLLLSKLRQAREAAGLTQEQLAERMGAPVSTVTAIESHGADPTLSTIRRYALAVGAAVRHDVQGIDANRMA